MGDAVNFEEAASRLRAQTEDIKAAGVGIEIEPLERACQQVAQRLRQQASRSGHPIGVKVVRRGDGVRMTVRGPQASRYRSMASRELQALVPNANAEIRAQITRKTR